MSKNRNWNKHLEEAEDAAAKKIGAIRSIYYKSEECSIKIIAKIFSAMIEPTLLYGSEIWGIEDTEERANRTITKLAKEMPGAKETYQITE